MFLPERCLLCDAAGETLCAGCRSDLPLAGPQCTRCAIPLRRPEPLCGRCQKRRSNLVATRCACRYDFPADELVTRLKFHRELKAAGPMADLMRPLVEIGNPRIDCLVPVPLHPLRRFARGHNQAAGIAIALARRTGLPVCHGLRRRRHTRAQSSLPRKARLTNVRASFSTARRRVKALDIGLVDDVITTGATVEAAAAALLAAGAASVTAIAFARAD